MNDAQIRRSLRLLSVESVITKGVFVMPLITLFYGQTIGMSYAMIGLSQAIFTAALMVLNVPTGWVADRFSRKWCNVGGDALCAAGYLYLSQAQTFLDVIICEIMLGVGLAFSGGADAALLRAYTHTLGIDYRTYYARVVSWGFAYETMVVLVGGVFSFEYVRWVMLLNVLTYGAGAVMSLFITEAGERHVSERHPLHDMWVIVHYALRQNRRLAWTIAGFVTCRESTHQLIWILTPLLVVAGVPAWLVGFGWALNLGAAWLGTQVARRYVGRLHDPQILLVSLIVYSTSALALSVSISLLTVWLYAGFGFTRGWSFATTSPMIQQQTPPALQATVLSVAGSTAQLLYIPSSLVLSAVADHSLQASIQANLLWFTPLIGLVVWKFFRNEWR